MFEGQRNILENLTLPTTKRQENYEAVIPTLKSEKRNPACSQLRNIGSAQNRQFFGIKENRHTRKNDVHHPHTLGGKIRVLTLSALEFFAGTTTAIAGGTFAGGWIHYPLAVLMHVSPVPVTSLAPPLVLISGIGAVVFGLNLLKSGKRRLRSVFRKNI